ncbi:hypothetical protein V5O48_011957, partial [Marasmius crinis-equi]
QSGGDVSDPQTTPLLDHPDPDYEAILKTVITRNYRYHERYRRDVQRVRDIVAYLEFNNVQPPNGERLAANSSQSNLRAYVL